MAERPRRLAQTTEIPRCPGTLRTKACALSDLSALRPATRRNPLERLHELLISCGPHLGPTQLEHLTVHSHRVADFAVGLGRALRVSGRDLWRLRVAGLLHDVGKLLIPEDVLAKPAALSDDEWRLVARHAADGVRIAGWLGADRRTRMFVRYHHVSFDRIAAAFADEPAPPLGASVLAVADAFVAMTTPRPYQAARTLSGAVEELQRERGRQFDPRVVDAATAALN